LMSEVSRKESSCSLTCAREIGMAIALQTGERRVRRERRVECERRGGCFHTGAVTPYEAVTS
jgi:hypothetical protein